MPDFIDLSRGPGGPAWLEGPSIGPFVQQGFQEGLRNSQFQQELALKQKEFSITSQLKQQEYDLRSKAMDASLALHNQEIQLNEIKLKNEMRDRQDTIDSDRAFSKVARIVAEHEGLGIAGTDSSNMRIYSAIANDPVFYKNPGARDLLTRITASQKSLETARESEAKQIENSMLRTSVGQRQVEDQIRDLETIDIASGNPPWTDAKRAEAATAFRNRQVKKDAFEFEKQRQQNRIELLNLKTEMMMPKLPETDRLQMQAELTGLQFQGLKPDQMEAATDKINAKYQERLVQPGAKPKAESLAMPADSTDPTPKTKAEFDALPSGTWFINPATGERRRKK